MPNLDAPFYPIIYVRGYAMTRAEIDETTVDPFCGFNLGSTVYRATPDKSRPPRKYVFESPVLRLCTDFGYSDVFDNGLDITDEGWTESIPSKSIVIYRYYDEASSLLGSAQTPTIDAFAEGVSTLILRVRDLVCQDPKNETRAADFRWRQRQSGHHTAVAEALKSGKVELLIPLDSRTTPGIRGALRFIVSEWN